MRRSVFLLAALALLMGPPALREKAVAAAPPVKKVTIADTCPASQFFCYKPAVLTVKPGTKVVWTDASWAAHTVTRCTKAACGVNGGTGKDKNLASPSIPHNKKYSFTFRSRGTYRYFCKPHGYGSMHATIIVK
jgi:plastocyanin